MKLYCLRFNSFVYVCVAQTSYPGRISENMLLAVYTEHKRVTDQKNSKAQLEKILNDKIIKFNNRDDRDVDAVSNCNMLVKQRLVGVAKILEVQDQKSELIDEIEDGSFLLSDRAQEFRKETRSLKNIAFSSKCCMTTCLIITWLVRCLPQFL
jgi:hypothetical protein